MLFVESVAAAAGSDSNNAAGRRSEPDSFCTIYNIHAFTGATYLDLPLEGVHGGVFEPLYWASHVLM